MPSGCGDVVTGIGLSVVWPKHRISYKMVSRGVSEMVGLLSLREYLHDRIELSRVSLAEAKKGGDTYQVKHVGGYQQALLTILAQVEKLISQERA